MANGKPKKEKTREEHLKSAKALLESSSTSGQPATEHLLRSATTEAILALAEGLGSGEAGGVTVNLDPVVAAITEMNNDITAKLDDLIKVTARVEARLNQQLNVKIL